MKTCIVENDIEMYLRFLREEERCPATVEKYLRDARRFLAYLQDREMEKQIVLAYKQSLMESGYEAASVNSMLVSLNSFLKFIGRADLKVKFLKIQKRTYCDESEELSREEYFRLVKAAEEKKDERLSMILQTICATGIRISELQFITAEAVYEGVAVVNLKGKTRQVFIDGKLRSKLLRYIKAKNITTGAVFVTRSGKLVNRSNVWRDMKHLCKAAHVDEKKVFPHNLRHLFARVFYKVKKDIAKLADILGHSSVETTRIYLTESGKEHRAIMQRLGLVV